MRPGAVIVMSFNDHEDWRLARLSRARLPFDPKVVEGAKANGLSDAHIEAARSSPFYRFVKEWEIGLPLHPELRTLPMLFYVPPMLPVLAAVRDGRYEIERTGRLPP